MKFAVQLAAWGLCFFLGANLAFAQSLVLYDFTMDNCTPCRHMKPIVLKLQREGFPIQFVDAASNSPLISQYNIQSYPTFVLVANGKEVTRLVGATTEQQLRQWFVPYQLEQQQRLQAQAQAQAAAAAQNAQAQQNAQAPRSNSGPSGFSQPMLGEPGPFPAHDTGYLQANASQSNSQPNSPQRGQSAPSVSAPAVQLGAVDFPMSREDGAVIRAQFDENNNITKPTAHIDSQAANVRIRIRDDRGINFGSGVMIESRPGITYVLTCGHIFRNLSDSTKVDIDVFAGDRYESFVGKVEKYDLDGDVGLVSIPTDRVLPIARLAMIGKPTQVGSNVYSVGCGGGQPPSLEKHQITALNRYVGPDTVECSGTSVPGRSGGGLFNDENELIGVCMGTDPKEGRSVYPALAPIAGLLEDCGLGHLVRRVTPVNAQEAPALLAGQGAPQSAPSMNSFAENNDLAGPFPGQPSGQGAQTAAVNLNSEQLAGAIQALQGAGGAKLTIVIENPQAPGQTQVVIIPSATARLIADLTGELQNGSSVAVHRPSTPDTTSNRLAHRDGDRIEFSAPSRLSTLPENQVDQNQAEVRGTDRSATLPTDFSAAQPFRREKR